MRQGIADPEAFATGVHVAAGVHHAAELLRISIYVVLRQLLNSIVSQRTFSSVSVRSCMVSR